MDYMIPKGSFNMPELSKSPLTIDTIDLQIAEIRILQMMDASDNSAKGVGQMLQHIANQLGMDPKEVSEMRQILEGNLGTNMNIESLRKKRHPSGHLHKE